MNTTVAGDQDRPSVASDAAGNFVVAWASAGQDGSGFGIVAHPDSPKRELSWREWAAPFDAIELVNPDLDFWGLEM